MNLVEFELPSSSFDSNDRERINKLKAIFAQLEDHEQDEEDNNIMTLLRQQFNDDELTATASSLERGVIAGVEAIESIWFIVGEFLYIMSRAGLWKYLDGEPETMYAWANMREIEYEDLPNHPLKKSYPLLSKWRLIYRRWFYQLGRFDPEIVEAIRHVRNVDVLETYSRIVSPAEPDIALEWAVDAQEETDKNEALRKVNIATQIAQRTKKQLFQIRPGEVNKELNRQKKKYPHARPAQRVPKRYRGSIPNSAYVEEEVTEISDQETHIIIRVIDQR